MSSHFKVLDTQSMLNECHFFIAKTNKVRSNKLIAISLNTFIIKVLIFIFIKPPFSLQSKEDDTQIKCS